MITERINDLIAQLRKGRESNNAVDLFVDVALFQPDDRHKSVSINAAGTKLVYERHDGGTDTYRALDHTLNADTRASAIRALQALVAMREISS